MSDVRECLNECVASCLHVAQGACATSPDELRSVVATLFFDADCLEQLPGPCPWDPTNLFMRVYAGQLTGVTHAVSTVAFVLLLSLAQAGGVPRPGGQGWKFRRTAFAFFLWYAAYAAQWFLAVTSLVAVVGVYPALRRQQLGECMLRWGATGDGLARLDVVWAITFALHPMFLFRAVFVLLYARILVLGARELVLPSDFRRWRSALGASIWLQSGLFYGAVSAMLLASLAWSAVGFVLALCMCALLPVFSYVVMFRWGAWEAQPAAEELEQRAPVPTDAPPATESSRHAAPHASTTDAAWPPAAESEATAQSPTASPAAAPTTAESTVKRYAKLPFDVPRLLFITFARSAFWWMASLLPFAEWNWRTMRVAKVDVDQGVALLLVTTTTLFAVSSAFVLAVSAATATWAGDVVVVRELYEYVYDDWQSPSLWRIIRHIFAFDLSDLVGLLSGLLDLDVARLLSAADALTSINLFIGLARPIILPLLLAYDYFSKSLDPDGFPSIGELFSTLTTERFRSGIQDGELSLRGKLPSDEALLLYRFLKQDASLSLTNLDLANNQLTDTGALALADVLQVNATLTTLWLQGNQIGDAGATGLTKALEVNATLTNINLLRNKFSINAAVELVQAAKSKGTQLKSLCGIEAGATSASFAGLGDSDAILLAYDLEVNATLTTLWLNGNKIGDSGAIGLGKALEVNATLTALSLYDNQIGDAGAIGLGEGLKVNATLTTLNLWGNQIGDSGAIGLGKALEVNATLTTLWLQGNQIGDAGAIGLAKALEVNETLTKLELFRNQIGDAGAIGLGKALEVNATLTALSLYDNQIGDAGAIGLGEGLKVNATLTTLRLDGNKIGASGAIGLGKALEVNATLTSLSLSNNTIRDAGVIGLGKALEVNATLTKLDLEGNQIRDSGAIGLGKALEVNATLTTLWLSGNNLGDTSKKTVQKAWRSKTGRKTGLDT
jgi:Ran GTPase-activating protein (RanGAP) involved in mRNA processing and transport